MEMNARISVISSNGSSTTSDLFQQDFSGKELLLLLRLQSDPELFESWKKNVISGDGDVEYSLAVSVTVNWSNEDVHIFYTIVTDTLYC